tara:strand:+ start:458 stop:844 length:387 start_codon:yes stop_codon:yes gene_type:complete
MYTKMSYDDVVNSLRCDILSPTPFKESSIPFKEITIENTRLICTIKGDVFRMMKSKCWKRVENKNNHNKGYNVIVINKKQYMRAKLILYAFKDINLEEKNVNIHHSNGNRLDCGVNNLVRICKKHIEL